MLPMRFTRTALCAAILTAAMAVPGINVSAQEHGRKWQPPPPTAPITITVIKAFNNKPFENAGVVFRAVKNGKDNGTLEVKTNPDGDAKIDVLEVGSHILVQVIAPGYATAATEFDLTADGKQVTLKLQRPKAQVSTYENNDGKSSQTQPGVQERVIPSNTTPTSKPQ
jgi:HSP20 family molecular chaperone IbpA